jgi:hypothetical protein
MAGHLTAGGRAMTLTSEGPPDLEGALLPRPEPVQLIDPTEKTPPPFG